MADIATLLGMRTGRGADMEALAAELRGQADLGDFLSLSGSDTLRGLGESQRRRALGAATRGGSLREAMKTRDAQARREAESTRRWEADRAERAEEREYQRSRLGEPVPMRQADGTVTYMQYDPESQTMVAAEGMEGMQPYVQGRTSTAMPKAYKTPEGETKHVVSDGKGGFRTVSGEPVTDMTGWEAVKPGTVLRPGAKERENTRKSAELVLDIGELNQMYEKLSQEQRDRLDSPKAEVMFEMLPGDDIASYLKSSFYDDPQVLNYLSQLARVEAALSKVQAGLSVTGFEMSDRKRWSPNAPGIGQRARNLRLNQLQDELLGEVTAFNRYYTDNQFDVPDAYRLDLEAPPPEDGRVVPLGPTRRALPAAQGQAGNPDESDEEFLKRMGVAD